MSFTGNGQKFVGDDGFVKLATFGAEVAGDGSTPLPVGTYLVVAVAGSSGFPPNSDGTAIASGDFLQVDSGITITPAVGDDVVTMTLANQCDISSWAMEFSKEEIDVTTLCDYVKKYRAGKSDMAGTMNGVFTAGITDDEDGFMRQFIDIKKQDGALKFDTYAQGESIMLGWFYINDDTNLADVMVIIAPFQLFGMGIGGEMGAAQSFSSSFRFANLSYDYDGTDVGINPAFYRIGDGSEDT